LTFSCYKGFKFLQAERTCKWLAEAPDWIPRITHKCGKKTERLYWQSGGGFDRNVIRPDTLMSMIDYVHMNPVRRGLEKSEEWKWSIAAWYLGAGEPFIVPDQIPPEWLGGVS
jgi:putative transposase